MLLTEVYNCTPSVIYRQRVSVKLRKSTVNSTVIGLLQQLLSLLETTLRTLSEHPLYY
jgi:hypothetical protein